MDLTFIRHGQGIHTLNTPDSLLIKNPSLTYKGIEQAKMLRHHLPLSKNDFIVVSPTRRTMETALIWSNDTQCEKIISPMVSPRLFPQKTEGHTLPCDEIIGIEIIKREFPIFALDQHFPKELWTNGINTMPVREFKVLGERLLRWCKQQSKGKAYIVSHDGTITSYRQLISNRLFTRDDFLEDGGWINVQY
ncbi:histidine phosphatase family protein [Lentibacillus sp. L22]|uniref:histidine phosphatase family protein n=1 Tax=Lentibacillus sp. L22 TaxID=3163028 RepID=UPI00346598B0